MEDSLKTESPSVSDIPNLRHRFSVPDVPEDVDDDVLLHFNDPNWDFQENSSTLSISTDGVVHRRWSKTSSNLGASTDVDTESHASSWPVRDSKADFSNEAIQVQDSPYPEVRAAVANTDDPTMPVNTFRMWFIGLLFALIVPAFNTVIALRSPFVFLNVLLIQFITLPLGKFMEWVLPTYRFSAFGYSFTLNPGPFNIKEHTLIAIMANVVVDASPITDIAAAMRFIYGVRWPVGKQFFLGITAQLLGFSIAGALRKFLVWPASMIFPGALVRCALLNTMHSNYGKKEPKHISREHFLYISFACSFLWYWAPGYLWTGLSVFNWVCWIAPHNVTVNSLFGTISGFGMGIFTLDWSAVTEVSNPLVVPWWAQLNMMGGFMVVVWFLCPILWAKNVFFSQFIPVSVPMSFDNTGAPYNLSAIVTNNTFDRAKYEEYSPMFLPITYAVSYGTIFATYPAVVVHTFLWYRHDIVRQFRRTLKDEGDIHSHLMRKYPETPDWWFITLGVGCFVLGVIGIEVCRTGLPVWAFVVSIILASGFALPFGIIQAITNQQLAFEVLAELLVGYVLPGRPVATMVFRTMGGSTVAQAITFITDLKFGYYMKVPPRIMFSAQLIASIVAVISAIVAQEWALDHIPDICSPHQKSRFTCPNLDTFQNSSVIWGAMGPRRFFSPGAIYYPLIWFFLIGALLPIPFYFLARRYPRSRWRYVHIPVALSAPNSVPPINGMNYGSWIIVGFIFQWFARRFHFRWWMRYNYLLATGLDTGVIVGSVVIFFALQLGSINLSWWGNNVWENTADAQMIPIKTVPAGQIFGPSTWT